MLRKIDKTTKEMLVVTKNDCVCVCQNVKDQCIFVAKGLITKLDKQFLTQDLMNVMGIIYL
jgi:phosphatidylserine decarboxylase